MYHKALRVEYLYTVWLQELGLAFAYWVLMILWEFDIGVPDLLRLPIRSFVGLG